MAIPKIIHYCWFGSSEVPDLVAKCIESWKKYCPEYEIKLWNESNYDVNKNPYIKEAYKHRKWAFVSDYARLDILYMYGGFYLDTDVELRKSLNELTVLDIFMALERDCNINTGLGYGSVPQNEKLKKVLDLYINQSFVNSDGTLNLKPCTKITTDWFSEKGFIKKDIKQVIEGITILSSDYFCPMDYKTGRLYITNKTYGIHWYNESWMPFHDRIIHQNELKVQKVLPQFLANPICKIYRYFYRFVQYTKEGRLIKRIKQKFTLR